MFYAIFVKMDRILARIGRGCPPSTPRHFWDIFGKGHFSSKISQTVAKIMETSTGRKTDFFLRNHENKKDAHRHDSKFRGPMTSPSSIWSPFVKKRVWAKNIDFTCNFCARTRFVCMHKIHVHARDSCACTRFLCMHKILVHAQESCACTRTLCMHKILVHAHDSCACTRLLCMHSNYR